ncbi:MAG: isochorismate synthase [Brooklawnia sp.]
MIVNPGTDRLHASTIRIDDPGPLADFLGPTDAAFLRGTEGFVALGEIARFDTRSMAEADQWWTELLGTIDNESEMPGRFGTGPLVYGSFCFDPGNTEYHSVLVLPEFIIGRRDGQAWLTQIGPDRISPELPPRAPEQACRPVNLRFGPGPLSETEWMNRLRDMTNRIKDGQASKVVMAREIVAQADEPIDPRWPLRQLLASYGSCWNYLIDGLVGSTPEMLVRRAGGLTLSRVLAGTIPRVEGVDDAQQAARLVSSNKDLEEHQWAVRSVVDSLQPYLSGMHVPDAPYVLTLPNVMHLATDICGISPPQYNTLVLARAAHPSAAVCGSPTDVARQLIAEYEQLDRGRFAGPVGWVDAQGDGEWAIALRCGQLQAADPRRMHIYAGAGVVAASKPHAELVETDAKMEPMKQALRADH